MYLKKIVLYIIILLKINVFKEEIISSLSILIFIFLNVSFSEKKIKKKIFKIILYYKFINIKSINFCLKRFFCQIIRSKKSGYIYVFFFSDEFLR